MQRTPDQPRTRRAPVATRLVVTAAFAALLWGVLTGGEPASWTLGVPAVVLAALAVLVSPPPWGFTLQPAGAILFLAFFLVQSVRAGADVAARALSPRMRLCPGFIQYRSRLPRGAPRTVFMAVIGLLPGTLTVRPEGPLLRIHVLDTGMPVHQALAALERRVGGLYGVHIEIEEEDGE